MSRKRPMGKRRAKRTACKLAARLIDSYMTQGQPYLDCMDSRMGWGPQDADPLEEALKELLEEMERRAGGIDVPIV